MRAIFVALVLLACLTSAARPRFNELEGYTFEKYIKDFKKHYSPKEYETRKALFEQRLKTIKQHNSDLTRTWNMGVNHLTDLTEAERRGMRGTFPAPPEVKASGKRHINTGLARPHSVDYRRSNPPVLTAVKDQGMCGSCWGHASTQSIESAWAIATGELYVLSQQQIVSCTPNPKQCGGTGGCGGNIAEQAFDYVAGNGVGITQEWSWGYTSYFGESGTCKPTIPSPVYVNITGYTRVGPESQDDTLDALAHVGPLAISVDASAWPEYEGGIFQGCPYAANISMDHAVQLVGYGHDDSLNMDYWIVRNSWSPAWGEEGYIRLQRTAVKQCGWNVDNQNGYGCAGGPSTIWVCGICGILSDPLYVNV